VQRHRPRSTLRRTHHPHGSQRSSGIYHQPILGVTSHCIFGGGIHGQIGAPGLDEERPLGRLGFDVPGQALATGILRFKWVLQFILPAGSLQFQLLPAVRLSLELIGSREENILTALLVHY